MGDRRNAMAWLRTLLVAAAVAVAAAEKGDLYGKDGKEKNSLVEQLNHINYATHLKKPDSMDTVKLVEFHKDSANCKSFVADYNKLAKTFYGVLKVTAVNCNTQKKICDEYGVKDFPTLKVIPPGGFGTQDYTGERNEKAVYSWAMRFFSHFVEKVTADNVDAFLNKESGKYKALLFTDKPKTPLMWRGVSVSLKGKMSLGVVQKDEKAVTSRFKVSKFPQILVVKPGQKKPIKYDGKLTDIREIFEFLNKYQETFAMENSAADEELAAKKPWLSEAVPELNSLSAQDVCYGADAWCVIVAGKRGADDKLEKPLLDIMTASKGKHSGGTVKLSFMWVDAEREKTFVSALGIDSAPKVAVLRTGKRTRYAKSEDDVTAANLEKFLERVLNSDVQYTNLKGGPPELTKIEPPADDKKKKK